MGYREALYNIGSNFEPRLWLKYLAYRLRSWRRLDEIGLSTASILCICRRSCVKGHF